VRVSAVIPCYNASRWIGAALASVAGQQAPVHEILVVDDGSTDDSLRTIEQTGIEVRLLHTRRAGGAAARNAALQAATGDAVAFLDADDVWYPDHLSRAVALLRDDVAYLAHYDRLRLDGTIEPLPTFWPIGEPTRNLTSADFLRLFRGHQFFGLGSLLARRDVLLAVGGFDEAFTRRHDLELFLRLVAGRTFCFDPRAAYAYREDTPGSLSSHRPSRELFFLRALLKNRASLEGEDLRALIRLGARRALSHAYSSGTAADRRAAQEVAVHHLSASDRAVFTAAAICPPLFGLINRTRQRFAGPLAPP
jgi:glycosyltransferase involved in cell wall biosynthesis